jgi:hypothetical protein
MTRKRPAKPDEQIFVMKIIQGNPCRTFRQFPHRVLEIPGEYTLYQFARAINDSFGFYFDHPFGFYDNLECYFQSREGYELFTDMPDTRNEFGETGFGGVKRTRVKKVFTKPVKKMLYLFDYGDEWHFLVQLLAIEPAKPGKPYPTCIEEVGEALAQYEDPDEDDGGDGDGDDEEDRQVQ